MKFCYFPTRQLERYVENMSDMHLVIANWAADSKSYAQHYRRLATMSRKHYVIMDNGTFEYRTPIQSDEFIEAFVNVLPNEVVLPDVIGNAGETLMHSRRTYRLLEEHCAQHRRLMPRTMCVPQGKTREEWFDCLKTMCNDDTNAIGFASSIGRFHDQGRKGLLDWVCEKIPELERSIYVHMLGVDENLAELVIFRNDVRVRSMDSGKLISLAFYEGVVELGTNLGRENVAAAERVTPSEALKYKFHSLGSYPGRPNGYVHRTLSNINQTRALGNCAVVGKFLVGGV